MAKIEVSRELYESLDAYFYETVGVSANRYALRDVLELMDKAFSVKDFTQELPGPEGFPNELVPADFFLVPGSGDTE